MTNSYSGVWRAGSGGQYLWTNATWPNFRAKWQELNGTSLRLISLNVHRVGSSLRYSGVWRPGSGGHYLWVNATWSSFRAKWQELAGQGLRLVSISVVPSGNGLRYSGVWLPGTDAYYLWVGATWSSFRSKWQELNGQNLRLVDIDVYQSGSSLRYAGVWRAGSGGHYLWVGATWSNFVAKWRELAPQGLRLTVIKSYFDGNTRLYAGVWRPGTDAYYLWGNARWANFRAKWRELNETNLRLVHLDVLNAPSVPTTPWVRLHLKRLTDPTIPIDDMVANMREVFNDSGIQVEIGSDEALNLPTLNDLDVGSCTRGNTTTEQNTLFANRNNVGANDIPVYFVRSTIPPLNGCAAHPAGEPACVVARGASGWTLGHEIGHVLGLNHVNDNDRLMTGNGTNNITNPPPDLVASEVRTMDNSPYTQNL